MSARHHDAYLGRLLWFHEHFGTGGLRVLQAVWPDDLGRYPDDSRLTDEERARFLEEQPCWTEPRTEPSHVALGGGIGLRLPISREAQTI